MVPLRALTVGSKASFVIVSIDGAAVGSGNLAAENGVRMDASKLRLVGPIHIAETRAKAFENVKFGFEPYLNYLNNNQPRFIVPPGQNAAEWFVENKFGVIGTPDDAIALIERLYAKQGDFGAFLQQVHNWADFEATKRSYELYQRYVMPHFSRSNAARVKSFAMAVEKSAESARLKTAATEKAFAQYEEFRLQNLPDAKPRH